MIALTVGVVAGIGWANVTYVNPKEHCLLDSRGHISLLRPAHRDVLTEGDVISCSKSGLRWAVGVRYSVNGASRDVVANGSSITVRFSSPMLRAAPLGGLEAFNGRFPNVAAGWAKTTVASRGVKCAVQRHGAAVPVRPADAGTPLQHNDLLACTNVGRKAVAGTVLINGDSPVILADGTVYVVAASGHPGLRPVAHNELPTYLISNPDVLHHAADRNVVSFKSYQTRVHLVLNSLASAIK